MDSGGTKCTDGLEYNSKGVLIPPQSGSTWDALTLLFAMAIPFITTNTLPHNALPPLGLQKLTIFQVLVSRDLLSDDQLRRTEFLLVALIAARFAGFPKFFAKYAGKYSKQTPPPDALRRSWPRQIRLSFLIPAVGIGVVQLAGILIEYHVTQSYVTSREVFLPIFILSLSLWFLIESIQAGVLCLFFYFKYWRVSV